MFSNIKKFWTRSSLVPRRNMSDECHDSINALRKIGVNFVGIDFDQTFISRHTGGRWQGSAEELAEATREEFRKLVPVLIDHKIHVAIVTFSGQRNLIENVLKLALGVEYAGKIIIRARDGSWGSVGPLSEGKQRFLASAAKEFEVTHGSKITEDTMLLIDDDENNIHIAMSAGLRGVLFLPDEPESLLSQIAALVE